MDEQALKEIPKLEARTGYLAMLGNIATLVGLLGTILVIIHTFSELARVAVDPAPNCVLLDMADSYGKYALRYWLTDLALDEEFGCAVSAVMYVYAGFWCLALSVVVGFAASVIRIDEGAPA